MQYDPALKEAVLSATGDEIPVVARLHANVEVPGLRVVARFGLIVTGRVHAHHVAAVRGHAAVASLKASRSVGPTLAASVPEIGAPAVHRGAGDRVPGVTGRGVLVAVIDWHCDFAHANFCHADGRTRLRFIWDQRGGSHAQSPAPFGYGRLLDRRAIDAALRSRDPYAALAYDPARADPGAMGSHGTHVLDIAAGNGRAPGASVGVAPEAELAFVHLRGDDTLADDTLGDSVRLLEAVRLVADLAGDTPLVINMSLGAHGGPHDGTTLVEQALDALLGERPGIAITMSTGNYFSGRTHTRRAIGQGEAIDLGFSVSAAIARPVELEAWYSGDDVLGATLIDPRGRVVLDVPLGAESDGGHGSVAAYHRASDPNNGDHVVDVFLRPGAMLGRWTLRLRGAWIVRGRVDAWIERDDRGTQSRFDAELVQSTGTTGTICNGRRTIAVGAYDAQSASRRLMPFSSCGPTRDGRRKPDLCAPGARIVAARSVVLQDGERRTDGLTTKSGTSMAAPHVCGAIALVFSAALPRRLTIDETRRIVLGTARPIDDDALSRLRHGHGRLDVRAAVAAVRPSVDQPPIAPARERPRPSAVLPTDEITRVRAWLGAASRSTHAPTARTTRP